MEYILIFISAIFVNNIVLSQFLGICPFLGVSKKIDTSLGMSAAVAFVMTLATIVTWLIQKSDECELQLKEIQQQYHKKFMKVLPASKVYDVLRAEEKFHRQIFGMNRFGRNGRGLRGGRR